METLYRAMLRLNNEPVTTGVTGYFNGGYWSLYVHTPFKVFSICSMDDNAELRLEYLATHGFNPTAGIV